MGVRPCSGSGLAGVETLHRKGLKIALNIRDNTPSDVYTRRLYVCTSFGRAIQTTQILELTSARYDS